MSIVFFFVCFFGLLFLGAIAINGFFSTTRGYYENLPDGTRVKKGLIFNGWYFFWFREFEQPIKVQYKGKELQKILAMWQNQRVPLGVIALFDDYVGVNSVPDEMNANLVASTLGVVYEVKPRDTFSPNSGSSALEVRFYKEYTHYYWPEWLREWLAGCITCHSSWLGSIIFWGAFWLSKRATISVWLFEWANSSLSAMICTWVVYCFCLAYLSNVLRKKITS